MYGVQCGNADRDNTPKLTNTVEQNDCSVVDMICDDLPQEFVDIEAIMSACCLSCM